MIGIWLGKKQIPSHFWIIASVMLPQNPECH